MLTKNVNVLYHKREKIGLINIFILFINEKNWVKFKIPELAFEYLQFPLPYLPQIFYLRLLKPFDHF